MRVRSEQMDNALDEARAVAVTALIMPVITVPAAGFRRMLSIRRRRVGHKRKHARNVTLQHIDNSHLCAGANTLQ